MFSSFLSLSGKLPWMWQSCWTPAYSLLNSSTAVHLLAFAPHPVLWAGLHLFSFLGLLSLGHLLWELKSLRLFLSIRGWLPAFQTLKDIRHWKTSPQVMCERRFCHSLNSSLYCFLLLILCYETSSLTGSFKEWLWFLLLSRYFQHLELLFWFHIEISLVTS